MFKHDEETQNDISHGHAVIITARWILILSGWLLVLWQPGEIRTWELQLQILLLMTYTIGNFFLTVQWVKRSEAMTPVVYASSLADLSLITILVLITGGYESSLYVFYLPALFAISVTFPKITSMPFTLVAIGVYGLITLVGAFGGQEGLSAIEMQNIVTRLIMMAGVAFCAGLYRTLEMDRRHGRGRMFQVFKAAGSPEGEIR